MAVRGWLWAAWVAAANVASRRAGKWGTWTIFLLLLLLVCSHDGVGNRVSKSVNGSTTKYLVEDDVNPTGYPQVFDELTNGAVMRTLYQNQCDHSAARAGETASLDDRIVARL